MDPNPTRVVRAGPQCNGLLAPPDNPLVNPRRHPLDQPSWVPSQARITLALAVAAAPPEVLRDPPPGDGGARLQPGCSLRQPRGGVGRAPVQRGHPQAARGPPVTGVPNTCSPQPVPPGRAAARTVSLEVGNPSGNAAMVTAAAAAATTRHEAPTWRWRRRREGWLSTSPPSHSSTSWTLPVHSDCSKPLPYGDMATLLQRKCKNPPPARAGPRLLAALPRASWAKNLLMAVAASIGGKNLGCASRPHSSPSRSAHHWLSASGVPLSTSRTAPWPPSGFSSGSRRCP